MTDWAKPSSTSPKIVRIIFVWRNQPDQREDRVAKNEMVLRMRDWKQHKRWARRTGLLVSSLKPRLQWKGFWVSISPFNYCQFLRIISVFFIQVIFDISAYRVFKLTKLNHCYSFSGRSLLDFVEVSRDNLGNQYIELNQTVNNWAKGKNIFFVQNLNDPTKFTMGEDFVLESTMAYVKRRSGQRIPLIVRAFNDSMCVYSRPVLAQLVEGKKCASSNTSPSLLTGFSCQRFPCVDIRDTFLHHVTLFIPFTNRDSTWEITGSLRKTIVNCQQYVCYAVLW